jgi:hypothetical protein
MTAVSAQTPELKKLLTIENKRGGRLQIRADTRWGHEGEFQVVGTDSRGRHTRMAGTEAFLVSQVLDWDTFRPPGTPSMLDPDVIRAKYRDAQLRGQAG